MGKVNGVGGFEVKGFRMECPAGCGEQLESETRDGILIAWDVHREKKHPGSPAQWTDAHNKIQAAKLKKKSEQGG
jgi:hypothetical protein